MSSRGAWCASKGCLNHVDAGGWGQSQCARCHDYYCQDHCIYTPVFTGHMLCLRCLEEITQDRIAANGR